MGLKKPAIIDLVGFGLGAAHLKRDILDGYKPEQVWTCNNAHAFFSIDPDRIVAMDDLDLDRETHPDYVEDIISAGVPVYTSKAYDDLPNTVDYPLREVIDWFKLDVATACKVFTNTLCFMLALAAMEKPGEIRLHGFDFYPVDKERDLIAARKKVPKGKPDWQKYYRKPLIRTALEPGADGVAWLLGHLQARKQSVAVSAPSTLLDMDRPCFFYGYKNDPFM